MASLELQEVRDPHVADGTPLLEAALVTEVERDTLSSSSPTFTDEDEDWVYPHPTDFRLTEAPIDEVRELKVAVIGVGSATIDISLIHDNKL